MRIAVVGLGYVGLSLACLFSRHGDDVYAIDIQESRVISIIQGKSPLAETDIANYLSTRPHNLTATTNAKRFYPAADIVVIATPTDYDERTRDFNTSSIESVLDEIALTCRAKTVVIKSTVPVGYTDKISKLYPNLTILFSPEFLREGHALDDNLNPSRIVVGYSSINGKRAASSFATHLLHCSSTSSAPVKIVTSSEAEAIKLFSNTYLALRVAFFNELDTYAEVKGLDSKTVIGGVCLDPRIGSGYNNPSFGYGGYCLPKDSKQLLSSYSGIPQDLIKAIVDSNETRKSYIANKINVCTKGTVGIYRLIMKADSDNFRQSSVVDVLAKLISEGRSVIVYEPTTKQEILYGCEVVSDLNKFFNRSSVIVANRWNDELEPVRQKVYCRDLWNCN